MSKTFERASTFPLSWPPGFPETARRTGSKFNTTLFQALENVKESLRKFGADSGKKLESVLISSNYSLTETKPRNPGVAVYFTWDDEEACSPVDRYLLVEDNLQAIYHCIEAKRTMLRHGGINLVKAAFRGYAALPNPDTASWRDILGYQGDDLNGAKKAYRKAIKNAHPDHGGDERQAASVNRAWSTAKQELTPLTEEPKA